MIDIDASEDFESVQLNEDFRQLGLGDDDRQSASQPPPSKRRRLNSKSSLLDELTADVCSLFASQEEINFAELDQIAEYVYIKNSVDYYLTSI
jgi:hypothetical protein